MALHQTGHQHSHGATSEQLNTSVRAAFVHVLGDLLQSVGVLIASYIIFFKVWVATGGKGGAGDTGRASSASFEVLMGMWDGVMVPEGPHPLPPLPARVQVCGSCLHLPLLCTGAGDNAVHPP